jgi:chromosome segregation ATPase
MAEQPARTSISVTPDEAPARRRPSGSGRKPRAPEGGDGGRSASGGGRGGGLGLGLAVLGLVGLAVAGWFLYDQHELLRAKAIALESAHQRILVLEERLQVTDEALTETGQRSTEQITFWESEIRKLWAVVNERNLNQIRGNTAGIERLDTSVKNLEATLRNVQATVGRHESAFARQEQMVDQITNLDVQMQQAQRAVRDVVDRANAAQQSVAALNSGLANRVNETEQAVRAFDAYRVQTNNRIADIERRMGVMAP